jgi:phage virion morphogenesis protein
MIVMRIEQSDQIFKSLSVLTDKNQRAELMDEIGAAMVSSTQQRFIEGRDPEGKAWEKSGRVRENGGQTLVDSNRLHTSITHDASADGAAWGTNVIYAAIHQFGGDIRPVSAKSLVFQGIGGVVNAQKVTIPARPFLGISQGDVIEINAIINDWLREALS